MIADQGPYRLVGLGARALRRQETSSHGQLDIPARTFTEPAQEDDQLQWW